MPILRGLASFAVWPTSSVTIDARDYGSRRFAGTTQGGSSRADVAHEAVEFLAQACAFGRQRPRRIQHVFGRRAGFRGAAIHLHDIGGGFTGSLGDALNAAGDVL